MADTRVEIRQNIDLLKQLAQQVERVGEAVEQQSVKQATANRNATRSANQLKAALSSFTTASQQMQQLATANVRQVERMQDVMLSAVRSMEVSISTAMQQIPALFAQEIRKVLPEVSKSLKGVGSQIGTEMEAVGKQAGEKMAKGVRAGAAQEATKAYNAIATKNLVGDLPVARLTGKGLAAAGNKPLSEDLLAQVAALKYSGAQLSAAHADQIKTWEANEKNRVAVAKQASKEINAARKAESDVTLKILSNEMAATDRLSKRREATARANAAYAADTPEGQLRAQRSILRSNKTDENLSTQFGSDAVAAARTAGSVGAVEQSLAKLSREKQNFARSSKQTSDNLDRVNHGLRIFQSNGNDAHSVARGLASGFGALWLTWGNVAPLLAGAAVSNAFVQAVKQGALFNDTLERAGSLAEYSAGEVAQLKQNISELGKNSVISTQQMAEGAKTLALAGLAFRDLGPAMQAVKELSIAGDTTAEVAARALTGVAEAVGISAKAYSVVGDLITKTAATSKSSVESIAESMKAATAVSTKYGVSLQDIALQTAVLNNVNITGSSAGVAIRNFYTDLSGRSSDAAKELKRIGVELKDEQGRFKDYITVITELDSKLRKMGQAEARKSISIIGSERGDKSLFEGLKLSNEMGVAVDGAFVKLSQLSAKSKEVAEQQGLILSKLQFQSDQIKDNAGFASVKAAQVALTAQSQMAAAKNALTNSLQTAFQSIEPTIQLTAQSLSKLFNSPEFTKGIANLAGSIANLIQVMVEWSRTIGVVLTGVAGFVVFRGVVTGLAGAYATLSGSLALAKTGYDALTVSQVNAGRALATTAQAQAVQAGTTALASKGMLASAGVVATALIPGLNLLTGAIGLAAAGWMGYELWRDKATGEDKVAATVNNLKLLSDSLQKQIEDQRRINKELADGVDLNEALARAEAKRRGDTAKDGLDAINKQIAEKRAKVDKEFPARLGAFYEPQRIALRAREGLTGPGGLYEQQSALILSSLEVEAGAATLKESKAAAARIVAEKQRAEQDARDKSFGKGGAGGEDLRLKFGQLSGSGMRGSLGDITVRSLSNSISVQEKLFDTEKALNDKRLSGKLISEAEHYARSLALGDAYQAKTLALIEERKDRELSALADNREEVLKASSQTASSLEKLAKSSVTEMAKLEKEKPALASAVVRWAELNQKQAEITQTATEAIASSIAKRNDYIEQSSVRSLADAQKVIDRIKEIDQSIADQIAEMTAETARDKQLAGKSPEEIAQLKAELDFRKSATKELAKVQREAASLQADLDQLALLAEEAAVAGRTAAMDELIKKYAEVKKAKEEAEGLAAGARRRLEEGAKTAGEQAKTRALTEEKDKLQNDFSTNMAGAITTAVFEGGKKGGDQLRDYLKRKLLMEPFEMHIKATINGLFGGASGQSLLGGLGEWGKGLNLLGGLGGGFKDVGGVGAIYSDTLGSILSGIPLGGFASGGRVNASAVEVNERGVEMLSKGGRDYLLNAQGSTITPAHMLQGVGGATIHNSVIVNVDSRADQAQTVAMVRSVVQTEQSKMVERMQQQGLIGA